MIDVAEELKLLQEKNKKRKRNERIMMVVMFLALLALAFGLTAGFQAGYHQALVDFNVIRGVMI